MKWNINLSFQGWRFVLIGMVLLGVIIWALQPAPLVVEVATISKGEFIQQVIEEGRTQAHDVYNVTATTRGYLQRVKFEAGDRIKKGERVAKIFPNLAGLIDKRAEDEIKQRIQSLEAAYSRDQVLVERADVALKTANSDYRRNLVLSKRGYVSKSDLEHQRLELDLRNKEYESAKLTAHAASHEIEQAKATLLQMQSRQLQSAANFEEVLAPVDGQVLKVDHKSEGPIETGATILSIADISKLEIIVDILSTDAVQVHPGDRVIIDRWGGPKPLQGKVRLIEPGGFMKISALGVEEQRVNVIIDLTSPRQEWRNLGAEFRVEVEITVYSAPNVLQVPVSALFRSQGQWAVYVVEHNKARLRQLNIGRRNAQFAMIISGLSAGEKVILYPGEKISDGVRITSY